MKLILFFGIVLKFIVPIASKIYARNITKCLLVSENLNIFEVMPIRYDVHIKIRPQQRMLLGYTNILIEVKKPIKDIILHAKSRYGYGIEDEQDSASYKVTDFQFCEKKEILILQFDKMLDKGKYNFEIAYRSVLNKHVEEIFYPTWNNQNWMLTNLYTPNTIRVLFPCWDDPRVKATYNISIQVPANYEVLSSIPKQSSSFIHRPLFTLKFGRRLIKYQKFVSKPTHLIGFLIINDIVREYENRDIHYMWRKIDADKEFTYVLEKAKMVTSFFFNSMKIDTSNLSPEINHVVLPNSPMKSTGAPGLVVYREKDITFDEILDFPGQFVDVITLVSYEMARQLFIGVVSPQLGNDYVWLNEIFASFCGYYIMDQVWSSHRLMELFVVKIIQPTLNIDMLLESEPIISKSKNSDGIDGLLYPLLYHKKAFALIRMLLQLYNRDVFNEAIRRYVHERTKDIWTILEDYYLQNRSRYRIKEIMNTWLTIKHHPELMILRRYSEQRTISVYSLYEWVDNSEWIVPVNYITQFTYNSYNDSDVFWLDSTYVNTTVKSGYDKSYSPTDYFVIVNPEQTGYYRVNYDDKNWILISTYMQNNTSNISPITRAQLVNDAYYFATIRKLKGSTFIELTKHLKKDTDFIAWYPMFNILLDMSSYFKFPESNHIKEHFLGLLDGVLNKIGYENIIQDGKMTKSLRLLVRKWACKLGHSVCRNAALDRLMIYINHRDELDRIPAMLKEWIICDGLKTIDLNVWDNILDKAINYNNKMLLEYLSCTENSAIIVHYLRLMLQPGYFSKTDLFMRPICRKIVKNHISRNMVLRYVIDNYSAIVIRFDFPAATLLHDMIMNVYSLKDLDMIKEHAEWLYSPAKEGFQVFINLLESINKLITYRKRYLIKVKDKFQEFN
ncbi:thyrotropin-releasing hormone-degrading ectoenzyme-like [Odontomachus brunneus]|uniref:thyrotropin-releasing hormone-degrading ectoenzyme-like n=1 Tax=Odontomachus brunneus TaxID=486640 RepID=UPI0013F2AB32|nr:thyrotropin-releasing hormone-degrading ectoenzyme-like [Odontomachus brunneus]